MNPSELPSISIILTGHNEESSIRDAIRSVFGQDYEGPVEIILRMTALPTEPSPSCRKWRLNTGGRTG